MLNEPILVVGATGKTGSRVATKLEAKGVSVRRGARRSDTPFDWEDQSTWGPILSGVSKAYVTYFPDLAFPGAIEKLEAFVKVARDTGLRHIVLLSGRGEHFASMGEEVIRNSGLGFTIVRSAWFAQNFSEGYLRDPILGGVLPMPGGDIAEPIIDIDDIADVVVAALTEDGHLGERYEVTGPRLMNFAEMAQVLTATLGRPIQYLPITFEDFHGNVAAAGDAFVADVFTEIARETLDGRNAYTADGVERALSRKPRDFVEFAQTAMAAGAWPSAA
ncbi:MAG: NmrA family NAD(P)-binding protein [Pseudomonadota bacterium]